MASSGVYTEGSAIRDRDIATMYLRLILRVIGIEEVTFIAAGGSKVVDLRLAPFDFVIHALSSWVAEWLSHQA